MINGMDRNFMIFCICGRTNWNEEVLHKLDDEKLEALYEDVVERGENKK